MPGEALQKETAVLLVTCPDRKGVVARIAEIIYHHNGNILHADEHGGEATRPKRVMGARPSMVH